MQSTIVSNILTIEYLEALYELDHAAAVEAAMTAMDIGDTEESEIAANFLARYNLHENSDAEDILDLLPPGDMTAELLGQWRSDVNSEAFRLPDGEELLLAA